MFGGLNKNRYMKIKLTTDMHVQPQEFVQALVEHGDKFDFKKQKKSYIYSVLHGQFVISENKG